MGRRRHIKGLDKPSAGPLRFEADPLVTLAKQASAHEIHRLDSVAETMILVGVMAGKKVLAGHEMVTVGPAEPQFGSGVRSHNTVAAHCLPGRILLNARALDSMPDWSEDFLSIRGIKSLAMASKLRNLNGRTDVADRTVNLVDSLIEIMGSGRGLKPLFGNSVNLLLKRCSLEGSVNKGMINELVRDYMERYQFIASYACEERLDELIAAQPGAAQPEAESITHKMIVAEEYLDVLQDKSSIPAPVTREGCENTINEVTQA